MDARAIVNRGLIAAALLALALPAAAAGADVDVRLGGRGGDDITVISGRVNVAAGETVGNVFVIDGPVNVAGRVNGTVAVINGGVTISGVVDGDVFTVADRAVLRRGARVDGDLQYVDERPLVAPGATFTGKISDQSVPDLGAVPALAGALAVWVAVTASSLLLGVLLLLLGPRAADATVEAVRSRTWETIAAGIAVFVLVPLAGFFAAATLIGLPLGIGLLLAMLPLMAVAYVTSALLLGRLIVKPPSGRIPAFLVGLAILQVVALIPIVGAIIWLAATIFGLGALWLAIWRARSPQPPGAAPEPATS